MRRHNSHFGRPGGRTSILLTAALLHGFAIGQAPPKPKAEANTPIGSEVEAISKFFSDKIFLLVDDFGRFAGGLENVDRIVVPSQQLKKFIERELSQARRATPSATVASIEIAGSLLDDRVELVAKIGIRTTAAHATVPLELREANCLSATLASGALPLLERDGNGGFRATFASAGEHMLRLEMAVEAPRAPNGRRLALTLPAAPVKRVDWTARDDIVSFASSARTPPVPGTENRRQLRMLLGSEESIDLSWRTAKDFDPHSVAGPAAIVEATVRWQERVVETFFVCDFSFPSPTKRLSISLTPEDRVMSIEAESAGAQAAVRRVQPQPGKEHEVALDFERPASGEVRLRLATQRPLIVDAPMNGVGQLTFAEISRVSGSLRVERNRLRPIRATPAGNAVRLPTVALEADAARRNLLSTYRFDAAPASLQIWCPRLKARVAARCETAFVAGLAKTTMRTKVQLNVREGAIEGVRILAPAKLEGLSILPADALIAGRTPHGAEDSETVELAIAFSEPTRGDLDLQLAGAIPASAGVRRLTVPTVVGDGESQATAAVAGEDTVFAAPRLDAAANIVRFRPSDAIDAGGRRTHFRTVGAPAFVAFEANAVRSIVAASVESSVRFDRRRILVRSVFDVRSSPGPFDRLKLSAPAAAKALAVNIDGVNYAGSLRPGDNEIVLDETQTAAKVAVDFSLERAESGDAALEIPFARLAVDRYDGHHVILQELPANLYVAEGPWQRLERVAAGERLQTGDVDSWPSLKIRSAPNAARPVAWLAAAQSTVAIRNDGVLAIRSRYGIADLTTNELRLSFDPGCSNVRAFVDGKPAVVAATEEGIAITMGEGREPRSLEIAYLYAPPRSLGTLDRVRVAHHRFGNPIQIGNARTVLFGPNNRVFVRRHGMEVGGIGAALWSLSWATSHAKRDDWFEANGLNLVWEDSHGAQLLPSGTTWSCEHYGEDSAAITVTTIYRPLLVLLASGGTLAVCGVFRLLGPLGRWRMLAIGMPAVAAAFALYPHWVARVAEASVWGVAALVLLKLVSAFSQRRQRRTATAMATTEDLARRRSSNHAPVERQPSVHAARVASTIDRPRTGSSRSQPIDRPAPQSSN